MVYAGIQNSDWLDGKIEKYDLRNRFIVLEWRDDIYHIFKHCDYYLDTYPASGGLMVQYAARLRKPIINYDPLQTGLVESLICQVGYTNISRRSFEDIKLYLNQLIGSKDFYHAETDRIGKVVISKS